MHHLNQSVVYEDIKMEIENIENHFIIIFMYALGIIFREILIRPPSLP